MSVGVVAREWINAKEAARILGLDSIAVARLGERGQLTVRRIPGCRPRFSRADVERLAQQYTTPSVGS